MAFDITETHALLVGVGHYPDGNLGELPGAVGDALKFADWLVKQRGVPPENVQLLLSRTGNNPQPDPDGIQSKPVTYANLEEALDTLKVRRGRLLWVFWAGHGVQERDGNLRLLFQNATADNKRNLDLHGLLRYLRTDAFKDRWERQMFIVDACRNFASHEGWHFQMPAQGFPAGNEVATREQFALFAAREGQSAWESAAGEFSSGHLSGELLTLLQQHPADWPPDLPKITQKLIERFKQMCQAGQAAQVPSFLWERDWDGNRIVHRTPRGDVPAASRTPLDLQSRAQLVAALLTIDQFADRAARADLIAALRVPKVPWADHAAEHAKIVIDACSEVDWGFAALVDALDARKAAGGDALAECLDRCCMLTIGKWSDLKRFMQLMAQGLTLSHDKAAQALRRCHSLKAPSSAGEELFFRAATTFARLVRRDAIAAPPFFEYLAQCRPFFPQGPLLDAFDEWTQARAQDLKMDMGAVRESVHQFEQARAQPKTDRSISAGTILLIKVDPAKSVPLEVATTHGSAGMKLEGHLVTAWLRGDCAKGGIEKLTSTWVAPACKLAAELAKIVLEGYSCVEASNDPDQPFRVHVFLPMTLLDLAVEREPLDGRLDTLGENYHIVARSYDRFYIQAKYQPARKELRQQWACGAQHVGEDAVAWVCTPEECDVLSQLKAKLVLIGLKLPHADQPKSRERLLDKFLISGVPFALFLRGSRGTDTDTKIALRDRMLAHPPAFWSTNVTSFRAAASLAHLQCEGFTLLWDDPYCVPPDVDYRLKSS